MPNTFGTFAVVHSHFEPHHQAGLHHDADPEFDHGERVVWLDMAAVHALPFPLAAPVAALAQIAEPVTCSRFS